MLLPTGNSVKYHVEAWLLQPMKQYIITTRFDDVFTLFLFCFCFSLVSLHGDECKCIVQRRASPRHFAVDPSAYICMVRWQYYIITALLTVFYSVFCFVVFGGYAWRLIQVCNITVSFSRQYIDPRLLPSGNSVKYHVEAWLFQPMKQYIITTRFDDVLHLFLFWFWF